MATNGTPPPKWSIEPALLFVVTYYETDAIGQAPSGGNYTMRTLPDAEAKAKEIITDAGNVGVCTIQTVTASIVYPAIPWEDF